MKENSAHGFTEGSEVPKEQDVAHSFDWITHEKAFKLSCPRPTIPPEKLVYQHAVMELKKADAELTRLRSELQQKDEMIENIKVEYRNKGIDVCRYAAVLWSNENGKDLYELMKRLNELKSKAK